LLPPEAGDLKSVLSESDIEQSALILHWIYFFFLSDNKETHSLYIMHFSLSSGKAHCLFMKEMKEGQ